MPIKSKLLFGVSAVSLLLVVAASAIRAQSAPLAPEQVAQIRKIEGRLMAPCCYSQTILEHDSDVAERMRQEVTTMVASDRSEQEIITFFRTKYGETILVVPDGATGRTLTFLPVLAFAGCCMFLLYFVRRSLRAKPACVADGSADGSSRDTSALTKRIRAEIEEDWM
jgi:cytochrome c-type biogenesis protein CcmH